MPSSSAIQYAGPARAKLADGATLLIFERANDPNLSHRGEAHVLALLAPDLPAPAWCGLTRSWRRRLSDGGARAAGQAPMGAPRALAGWVLTPIAVLALRAVSPTWRYPQMLSETVELAVRSTVLPGVATAA